MAYTARNLINGAYYLSGVVARDLQEVSGDQVLNGLHLLNEILAVKAVDIKLVPFHREIQFDAVPYQEKYFVKGLISIENVTFLKNSVRFPMANLSRNKYFGSGRVEEINSLPLQWRAERTTGGTDLYLYFRPDQNYPIKIWGKFMLDEVSLGDDLSAIFEMNYLCYLRYKLAESICGDYNITFQPQSAQKLAELERLLPSISPVDLSFTNKISVLSSRGSSMNWAFVNLGNGWVPY